MNLIPDNVTVSEQCRHRNVFVNAAEKWFLSRRVPGHLWQWHAHYMDELESDSGVRCQVLGTRLTGFNVINAPQYLFFKLKYT